MALITVVAIASLILLIVLYAAQHDLAVQFNSLSHRLDELASRAEQLNGIAAAVAEIEDRTAPPLERASRDFERGQALTAGIIDRLNPGDVIRIVEKSWHHPARDPFIVEFDFELGSVGEGKGLKGELPVRGRCRVGQSEPWDRYEFKIGPDGATTYDGAGTIRGIIRPRMDDPLEAALSPENSLA